jgi:hypothetical protein
MAASVEATHQTRVYDCTNAREHLMRTYFNPWRRKIGILTLAMACVFAVGWIRSHDVRDLFVSPIANYRFESFDGDLLICVFHNDADYRLTFPVWESHQRFDGPEPAWRKQIGPLWLKELYPEMDSRDLIIILPYWSFAIPLSLLTAHLLLSKPNQSKPDAEWPGCA